MKFCEAMDELKKGLKVTRQAWIGTNYFLIDEIIVKAYQNQFSYYAYDEDIMISDGWLIDNDVNEYNFCDIIPFLKNGSKAKMKRWENTFIYYDNTDKCLVKSSIQESTFIPVFSDFESQDWIVL